MTDTMSAARAFWLVAVGAGFAPASRGSEPAATSPSVARVPSAAELMVPSAAPATESTFERAFRSRFYSSAAPSVASGPGAASGAGSDPARESATGNAEYIESAEARSGLGEFRPSYAPPRDPDAPPEIPNHPALSDRFFIGVGAFWATSNTEARLDSDSGLGTTIDFEDVLGLEATQICPQGLARWRMSERWRLEFEYFELQRENTTQIDGEIVWGDETFPIDSIIDTTFDVSVLRLSCGYSFFKRPDKELGVALGFHLTDVAAKLATSGAGAEDGTLLAPLPVISLYGQFALTDVWAIGGRLDAFRIEYEPYAGHIYSLGLDALCQPWRHVGFGFGWRGLEFEASSDSGSFEGRVSSSYQGPIAFVSVSF